MTILESSEDIRKQRDVMTRYLNWLQSLPHVGSNGEGFTTREMETKDKEFSHDFDVWWNHLHVGAVEVKCRTYKRKFFEANGFMIGTGKLNYLQEVNKTFPVAVVNLTEDDCLVYTTMNKIQANRGLIEEAPDEITTRPNHPAGSRPPQPHRIIPFELFEVIE